MEKLKFEAEIIEGLEVWATAELKKAGARLDEYDDEKSAGVLRFRFGKSLTRLQRLRVVNQVFQIHHFDVPRPKALLGQQHFDRISEILNDVADRIGRKNIGSFRLEAAGRDSVVFQRLISEIERILKIPHEPEAGDLFLRVKPAIKNQKKGWELLVRETVRPLSTRPWREFNYPGALAAPVAAVMLDMAAIHPDDKILNVMCGSGSLLAENADHAGLMTGIDLNREALIGAKKNLKAAGAMASLFPADATHLPFTDDSFDVLMSDLPWGQLIGEVQDVQALYPLVLEEAWRVTKPGGRFVVVTQLKKIMWQSVKSSRWNLVEQVSLNMGRVNPDIFLLESISHS
ncbi:MAG: TRM11 family methyltransferase [Anaerolineae bacterium]